MLLENVEDLSEDFAGNLTNHLWRYVQSFVVLRIHLQTILCKFVHGRY